ncbi:L-aspartate oxidase [Meridianimarinicoccus sp. MJW13]|uniref:L-aspartate oxidase n=1 Tax=Meridianimarinicoccus sp. MJW13 TaxID=2720031 RepID=UPI001868CE1A|nr:L-aspartate oxidase [Fluviibacterium sp. MJW13]
MRHRVLTDRIIIVGAGLGALYAALCLAPRPVVLLTPEPLGFGASSAWAQGGVAAAMAVADSPTLHADDTIRAGAGTVDPAIAALVTEAARAHIHALTDLGTPFDRDRQGGYVLSREAAHSLARVVRVQGDQAGKAIMEALIARVRATPSIQVLTGVLATGLVTEGSRVSGVEVMQVSPSRCMPVALEGPAVLLAGGGSGGLYARTTNPAPIRGQVMGLAARAGARMADMEFVQFHPTAIDSGEDPVPLATEALRGEGAVLVNRHGARFMIDAHPEAELAPRDVVARAVFAEVQAGNRPALDTRDAIGAALPERFPAVAAACARAGIDPLAQPIPVTPAAHYHMGGVATDAHGRASLDGLWVCGEAAATGLHGANRLASNGLLEALVFAATIAGDLGTELTPVSHAAEVALPETGPAPAPDPQAITDLRETMSRHVGVLRTGGGLQQALTRIAELEAAQAEVPDVVNMTATASLIAAAALLRTETRGSHARTDFPEADPALAQRSFLTLNDARALTRALAKDTA